MNGLEALQQKIGVNPDGSFGPGTLKAAMNFFKMTPERAAHFFGQTAHETGNFKSFSENLNYGASGLLGTFKKYFPDQATADEYARKPEKIANRVYANRMGNGDESSGDGFKYRGRGALQLTGKSNYQAFADYLNKPDIMDDPDLVADEYAFESAMFFFERNELWAICDQGINDTAILSLTKKINGGTLGLDDRTEKTKKYYDYCKNSVPVLTDVVESAPAIETEPVKPTPQKEQNNNGEEMLSENFALKDFIKSETATRKGIDNTPTTDHKIALKAVCEHILEPVFANYNQKVRINSSYRSPKLNAAVGGSAKSQHCNGEAVDFEIDGLSNPELAKWVVKNCEFDQVILEFYNPKEGPNSGWVHASYTAKGVNRHQILTAVQENGKTVYKPGFVL
jgi:putative chitinase